MAIPIFFLAIATFRLPMIYTAIVALVVVALCLVAAAYLQTPISQDTLQIAGYVVFVFAGLCAWVFLSVASLSLGGRGLPMGRPVTRPAPAPASAAATT